MPRGRKRKSTARRHPGGKIVHDLEPADALAKDNRSRAIYREARKNHWNDYGSELGRLYATGFISQEARDAAMRFASVYTVYARCKGIPSPNPPCLDPNKVNGLALREYSPEFVQRSTDAWQNLRDMLRLTGFANAEPMLKRLAIQDERPFGNQMLRVCAMLEALARRMAKPR